MDRYVRAWPHGTFPCPFLPGAKKRAQQQPKQQQQQQQHSSFEDELSEVFENQSPAAKHGDAASEAPSKDAVEKREDSDKGQQDAFEGTTEGPRPQAFPEPKQESSMMGNSQSPGEDTANNTQSPTSPPSQEHGDPQSTEGGERGLSAQQQARKAKQEEKEEEEEKEETAMAREKAGPKEVPTAASSSHFYSGYKKIQKDDDGMYGDRDLN